MRRISILLTALVLIATACSPAADVATTEAPAADVATTEAPAADVDLSQAAPRIAVIMAGTVNDAGFYTQVFNALVLAEEQYSAETTYTELVDVPDAERVMRAYAQDGWDIIIAHGGEYPAAVQTLAEDFPDVTFTLFTGGRFDGQPDNLWNIHANSWDLYYPAGVAAGLKSETGIAGWVGGLAFPSYVGGKNAFEQGMQAVNPDAQVLSIFVQHQDDPIASREAAQSFVDQGADVLMHSTNLGVFGVIDVVRENDVSFIGFSRDQSQLAPQKTITSAVQSYETMYLEIINRVLTGEKGGDFVWTPQAEGHLFLAPFYGSLTEEEIAIVEQAFTDMVDGTVVIEVSFEE